MSRSKTKAPATDTSARLSRPRIIEAALALVERDGLAGLSARRIAAEVGCEAMSLYHHVQNMADIHDGIVDHLLGRLALHAGDRRTPHEALRAFCDAYLELAADYPASFALVATRRWRTPNAIAAATAAVELFRRAGIEKRRALQYSRIVGAYLNGAGLAIAAWQRGRDAATSTAALAQLAEIGDVEALNDRAVRADLDAGIDVLLAQMAPRTN